MATLQQNLFRSAALLSFVRPHALTPQPSNSTNRPRFQKTMLANAVAVLLTAYSAKTPEIPPKPTTLKGQVFTQLESGPLVKASGREIFLTTPTDETLTRIGEACALSDQMSASILARVTGKRKVGREQLPLQFQVIAQSDMLATGVSDAFSRYGQSVAKTVSDADGRFTFDSVPSGEFVLTTKQPPVSG